MAISGHRTIGDRRIRWSDYKKGSLRPFCLPQSRFKAQNPDRNASNEQRAFQPLTTLHRDGSLISSPLSDGVNAKGRGRSTKEGLPFWCNETRGAEPWALNVPTRHVGF
ncbi:hypothetical protein ES288_A06G217100v1 [Gossypium darwinii]|uniref:Uncharacterized protein n=1 Tax=Gossypium darwinii TaxID=34276 RepID=A0A5D2G952_GOSDA|nr:hypothetical protein ES288_A06G217100v1 [Gossypium darwinii]